MNRILFTPNARRELKKLPAEVRGHIKQLLDSHFSLDPFAIEFQTQKLERPLSGYRVRIGRYRILFEFKSNLILIYKIKHRKDAYR